MFLTKNNEIKWKKIGGAAIVTLALVMLGIFGFDKSLFLFIRQFDCGVWGVIDKIFDAKVWIVVSGIAVLVFCAKKCVMTDCSFLKCTRWSGMREYVHNLFNNIRSNNAFLIFCSVLCAGIVVKILKFVIGRARPVFYEALDMTGFFPMTHEWAFNSMPSGHTAVSFAGLVMIGMLVPRYRVVTWGVAIVVGFSRVAIGAHWPTDVILGAFIGMVIADIVKGCLLKK